MSYLVFCVFDLKHAHREDYHYAYMDLAELGLRRIVKSNNGPTFALPSTAVMGMLDGRSVDDVKSTVGKIVRGIFDSRGLNGTFFVVVGHDWACTGDVV